MRRLHGILSFAGHLLLSPGTDDRPRNVFPGEFCVFSSRCLFLIPSIPESNLKRNTFDEN
jgi:hypothetical protein